MVKLLRHACAKRGSIKDSKIAPIALDDRSKRRMIELENQTDGGLQDIDDNKNFTELPTPSSKIPSPLTFKLRFSLNFESGGTITDISLANANEVHATARALSYGGTRLETGRRSNLVPQVQKALIKILKRISNP
jgi:hypothetical protein